jgi:hypothetical protein
MNIFVFGSNLSGHHGRGAALTAKEKYGAKQHLCCGFQGQAYAIPTKGMRDESRPANDKYPILDILEIEGYVERFLAKAKVHPEHTFLVTRIGCGLAGFTDEQMAPLFAGASDNCEFDPAWASFGLKSWSTPPQR